jgi:hypothetical protein
MMKIAMKRFKYCFALIFIISLTLLLLHCSEQYKEPAPFFDGLYLEYTFDNNIPEIYNITALGDNRFKIIKKTSWKGVFKDDIKEFFVDAYGRVYKSSSKAYPGGFSPIWIPVYVMQIGDTFGDGYQLVRKDKWQKWNVVVVKCPSSLGEVELYLESSSGFRVGDFVRLGAIETTTVLVNTNAKIPVAE